MKRLLLAAVLAVAMLVPAASASAELTGEYARFGKCPTSVSSVEVCIYAESSAGTFTLGKKTVPLKNPVILQGGAGGPFGIFGPMTMVAATDGNTLSKTPQTVPGGLLGIEAPAWWPQFIKDLFNETINNGFTGVTATVELAAPASSVKISLANVLSGEGAAFVLPVKVKLSNPFLGSNCYIGSNSSPINLNLTTGKTSPPPPNTSISGFPGNIVSIEEGNILVDSENKIVDNAFAAGGANGCGGILLSWAIDPFVNSIVGVPSAAGTNTAILEGTNWVGSAPAVKERQ